MHAVIVARSGSLAAQIRARPKEPEKWARIAQLRAPSGKPSDLYGDACGYSSLGEKLGDFSKWHHLVVRDCSSGRGLHDADHCSYLDRIADDVPDLVFNQLDPSIDFVPH